MKPFSLLKVPMLLIGFGAALLFAPTCKAQEVSPDHFDCNDSWEIAARTPVAAKSKAAANASLYRAKNQKASASPSMQLASAREVTKSAPRNAVAPRDKRKTTVRKTDPK